MTKVVIEYFQEDGELLESDTLDTEASKGYAMDDITDHLYPHGQSSKVPEDTKVISITITCD